MHFLALSLFLLIVWVCYHTFQVYKRLRQRLAWVESFNPAKYVEREDDVPLLREGREITPQAFDDGLAALRKQLPEPENGVLSGVSPAYMRVQRESCSMIAGLAATLSQIAHPFVAYGVHHHSAVRHDPIRRFYLTFKYLFSVTYGDWEENQRSARIVAGLHRKVRGKISVATPVYEQGYEYHATDEAAAIWVEATLFDYSTFLVELMCGNFTLQEKEENYVDSRRNTAVWGIRPEALPPNWQSFDRYVGRMYRSPILHATDPAKSIANLVIKPMPWERWMGGGFNSNLLALAVMLPRPVAEKFGLRKPLSSPDACADPPLLAMIFTTLMLGVIRSVYVLLPLSVRGFSRFNEWRCRMAGGDGSLTWVQRTAQNWGSWFVDQYLGEEKAKSL